MTIFGMAAALLAPVVGPTLGGYCKDELPRKVDTALFKGIARARRWFEEVPSGRVPSLAEVATRERIAKSYVTRLTRLAFVVPAIVDAVAEGPAPAGLNLQMVMHSRVKLLMEWSDQERILEHEA